MIDLRDRLATVQRQVKVFAEAESDIKAAIRDLLGGQVGEIVAHGQPVFEVSYSRRFDAGLAWTVLVERPDLLEAVTVTVVDSKKARAVLPPAVYELCQSVAALPTIKPKS